MSKGLGITFIFLTGICFAQIKKQYAGFMNGNGDRSPIEMQFNIVNDSIRGIYYYNTIGKDLLVGGYVKNDSIFLEEHNSAGKLTGLFTGRWYKEGDSIKGKWTRKKDGSVFKFSVKRTDWKDFKLIKKSSSHYRSKDHTNANRMIHSEWLEMIGHPNPNIQKCFNGLHDNQETILPKKNTEYGKGFYGVEVDGYTVYYTRYKETSVQLYNNYFISFSTYQSDFWGGGTENKMTYHLFDTELGKWIHLKDILRKDTASFRILRDWIKSSMIKTDKWKQFGEDLGTLEEYINESRTVEQEQFYFKEDGMYFFFCRLPFSNIFSIEDVRIPYSNLIQILDRNCCVYKWLIGRNQ